MTGAATGAPAGPARRGTTLPRPALRPVEAALLVLVGAILVVGSVSLEAARVLAAAEAAGRPPGPFPLRLAEPAGLAAYLAALAVVHGALVIAGRRVDEILLPVVGLLGGVGLLLAQRLPQGLATRRVGETELGLGELQLVWLLLALAVLGALAIGVRSDAWLRRFKYSWAAAGIALLLFTFVLGDETNGARLTLSVGPISGQPSELLKIVLVVFLAGYLAGHRGLLVAESARVGPLRVPPIPYLVPMGAMLAIAIGVVVVQRDLGVALLLYLVFLALLHLATGRLDWVLLGVALLALAGLVLHELFGHVRVRVENWLDPFADADGAGYQVVQALYAFARGGILGTGLGAGLPEVGGRPPIPAVHTDYPLAALGEELGLAGVLAVLACHLVLVERGLRVAATARDDFRALLAAGLALVVGVQTWIIAAGTLKVIPLTGITLPFVSYGGSSLLANALVVGLLLALSDRGSAAADGGARSRGDRARGSPGRAAGVGAAGDR